MSPVGGLHHVMSRDPIAISEPADPLENSTLLLKDQFTTLEAAPIASPRTADGTGSGITITQADSGEWAITADGLVVDTQPSSPSWGDMGYGLSFARAQGRAVKVKVELSSTTGNRFLGWNSNVTGTVLGSTKLGAGLLNAGGEIRVYSGLSGVDLGTVQYEAAGTNQVMSIMQSTGGLVYFKGGDLADWSLLWIDRDGVEANMYAGFGDYGSGSPEYKYISVYDLDEFSTLNINKTDEIVGSISDGTTFTHAANFHAVVDFDTLPTGGLLTRILFRKQDGSNWWEIRINSSGDVMLYEVVASSGTQHAIASAAVSGGEELQFRADDETISIWIDGSLAFTPYTGAANFKTETTGERFAGSSGGAISDLLVYPISPSAAIKTVFEAA